MLKNTGWSYRELMETPHRIVEEICLIDQLRAKYEEEKAKEDGATNAGNITEAQG